MNKIINFIICKILKWGRNIVAAAKQEVAPDYSDSRFWVYDGDKKKFVKRNQK